MNDLMSNMVLRDASASKKVYDEGYKISTAMYDGTFNILRNVNQIPIEQYRITRHTNPQEVTENNPSQPLYSSTIISAPLPSRSLPPSTPLGCKLASYANSTQSKVTNTNTNKAPREKTMIFTVLALIKL